MGETETAEWLSVAAGSVCHLPAPILDRAALEARRTCTHHSQIVPTIIREAEELLDQQHRIDRHPIVRLVPETRRLPAPKLTQEAIDVMPEKLRQIGVSVGAIIQDDDGNYRPAA